MRKAEYLRHVSLPSSAVDDDGCIDADSPEGQRVLRLLESRAQLRRRRRARRRALWTLALVLPVGIATLWMLVPGRQGPGVQLSRRPQPAAVTPVAPPQVPPAAVTPAAAPQVQPPAQSAPRPDEAMPSVARRT
jgi:hypothetical protein